MNARPNLRVIGRPPEPPRSPESTGPETPVEAPSNGDAAPLESEPGGAALATSDQRARAARRMAAVDRYDALVAEGLPRGAADRQAGAEIGVSPSAVARWRKQAGIAPDRLAALLDAPRSGRPPKDGPGGWSGDGADILWRHWCSDYLREEAPSARAAHRRMAAIAAASGWPLPPVEAFLRRTRREFTRTEMVRARTGALAAMDTVPAQRRTVAGMKPLDIINGDGRRFDVQVDFGNGRVGRPCGWFWQDVRTRRILAWRIGQTEAADLVRTSLHECISMYGVPGAVLVDNTRAASAKWLTGGQPWRRRWRSTDEELPGLMQLLDIRYSATKVDRDAGGRGKGRGRSKPVERAFGDLAGQIDSHPLLAGAGTGRSPIDRPETHRMRAAPLETFLEVVGRAVAEHNARTGRNTEAAAGRSFDETWNAEIPQTVIRRVSPAQAAILLLAAEDCRVKGDGTVSLAAGRGAGLPANRYYSPDLVDHAGRHVVVRFDPDRLHDPVQVTDRDGRWLCAAECLLPVGFSDTEAAGRWERARRQARRAAERKLAAERDMDALTEDLQQLPPPETPVEPEPAAVRLVTNEGARIARPSEPGPAPNSAGVADLRPPAPEPAPRRRSAQMAALVRHYREEES